ncbi:MAG: type I-E CRISPR-associated endonuclease Cas1e [Endomicrobium sp.]|nr:type I-E CRISPR-associated endonuclease Cas1e [Endomicrobium sp.]
MSNSISNYEHVKPITIKERVSLVFVEKGNIDVVDSAFVVIDETGVRTQIPIGGITCLMLEPGTRLSHAAAVLAARVGCLISWIGEAGVRFYSAGQPGGARSDKLLFQAQIALNPKARLNVVRKMYELRFNDVPPAGRSIEQLRGIEGVRVRKMYEMLAKMYKVKWTLRNYNTSQWDEGDLANRCLSSATACLYGITEAAILAAGYAPSIGFIHSGNPLSFVYDIADIYKFNTVVPVAFSIAARNPQKPEQEVRKACRDCFRNTKLLEKIIPSINDILSAGNIDFKAPHAIVEPVIITEKGLADDGHRS